MALDAIMRKLFQFGQFRIVIIWEFGRGAAQQLQRARVVARTQTDFDLLNDPLFGYRGRWLVACFLQALEPQRSSLAHDGFAGAIDAVVLARPRAFRTSQHPANPLP